MKSYREINLPIKRFFGKQGISAICDCGATVTMRMHVWRKQGKKCKCGIVIKQKGDRL